MGEKNQRVHGSDGRKRFLAGLEKNLSEAAKGCRFSFQQDNDPKPAPMLKWSSQSPYLNLIENLENCCSQTLSSMSWFAKKTGLKVQSVALLSWWKQTPRDLQL
ncbi:hypothetical protein XENORESO_009081 [Xenotaenia resolanae]|uniref:Uncharacterized protein n=1 Tax=Xenotaenia resolanae TaxID=208358 RepID=A0ABV0W1X1_9TELE